MIICRYNLSNAVVYNLEYKIYDNLWMKNVFIKKIKKQIEKTPVCTYLNHFD